MTRRAYMLSAIAAYLASGIAEISAIKNATRDYYEPRGRSRRFKHRSPRSRAWKKAFGGIAWPKFSE